MSQTYISIAVMVLAQVLPHLGVSLGNDALTTTATTLVTLAAAIWALVRRYQAGGINMAGLRK